MAKHIALDLFDYNKSKWVNIYDSSTQSPGSAHDIVQTNEWSGWKTLTFVMPYIQEGQGDNYRWDFIKNEFLVRLIDGDKTDWFVIHTPKKKHDAKAIENTVTCSHKCSGLKTKNIYLEFDGDTTGIGTLEELAKAVLQSTGWSYDETSDKIYEKDGTTEKIRSLKTSSSQGAYKLIADLCTLFNAYPIFNGDTNQVKFRSMEHHGDMREVMIGRDLTSIQFEENTEDIITRLYVEGEYGDDGYVGIDNENPTGLTYLLNFDYYKSVGLFTERHQQILDQFLLYMSAATMDIREYMAEILEKENELNDMWGQPAYVEYYLGTNPMTIFAQADVDKEKDYAIKTGDKLYIVGPSGTYREVVVEDANTFSFGTDDEYAVKFVGAVPAGIIGAKEASVTAKESAIKQLEREKNKTTHADRIAELDGQIAAIRDEIELVHTGVAETDEEAGTTSETGLDEYYYLVLSLNYERYLMQYTLENLQQVQTDLESDFYREMGDMLKDGKWGSTNYIQGQEKALYDDAVEAMETMSKPTRKYTVNRVAIEDALGYEQDDFDTNTAVRIYDPPIGVDDIVYVNKITRYLDQPWKDKIELTNESLTVTSKSLDSILQRITQLTSELESRKDIFQRSNAISANGQIFVDKLEGTLDVMKTKLLSSVSSWYTDDNGNIMFEASDGQSAMKLSGDGWIIANGKTEEGEWNWRTAATGQGIVADAITSGFISSERIEAGSIYGYQLDIHAGDNLDLSANESIKLAVDSSVDAQERSSGENILPNTTTEEQLIATDAQASLGKVDIREDQAGATSVSFRTHLRPDGVDSFCAGIRIVYDEGSAGLQVAAYDNTNYDMCLFDVAPDDNAIVVTGNVIDKDGEGWSQVNIPLLEGAKYAEPVIVNSNGTTISDCYYHSAKLEYGPPTPYSPSITTELAEVHQAVLDITPEYITSQVTGNYSYGTRNQVLESAAPHFICDDYIEYKLSRPMQAGSQYTLSVHCTPHKTHTGFRVYVSKGQSLVAEHLFTQWNRHTCVCTFYPFYKNGATPDEDWENGWIRIYPINPDNTVGKTLIHTVKLESGGVANNYTVAPEDNIKSGANLLQNGGFEVCSVDTEISNVHVPEYWNCSGAETTNFSEQISVYGPNTDLGYDEERDLSVNTGILTAEKISANGYIQFESPLCNLVEKETYVFSCYVSVDNQEQVEVTVHDVTLGSYVDGNGETVKTITVEPTYRVQQIYTDVPHGGMNLLTWKRVDIIFQAKGLQEIILKASVQTKPKQPIAFFVTQCKLEKGFLSTPYSPCALDEFDLVKRIKNAEVKLTDDSIVQTVMSSEVYQSSVNGLNNQIIQKITDVETKADGFGLTISQVQGTADSANSKIDELSNNIATYFSFKQDGLHIGKSDSAYYAKLDNTALRFKSIENGIENDIAWLSNEKLYITKAEVLKQFTLGPIIATVTTGEGSEGIDWSWATT